MISLRYIYIFSITTLVGLGFVSPPMASAHLPGIYHVAISDTTDEAETQKDIADSLITKKLVSGLELALDYGKITTLWTSFESKYEVGVNLRFFERLVLAAEAGYADLHPLKAYDNALYYNVKGSYSRIGLDYYTSYDPKSFYYAGLRYGMSNFEDKGAFLIDSDFWEDYEEEFGSTGLTASWMEIIVGTETCLHLFGSKEDKPPQSRLLLGWKFRFRILMDFQNREEPRVYSIPGYGRTFDKTVPALNFYVKYRFGR